MSDSKIFVPQVPSLLHMAGVKEAIKLYDDFSIETFDEAFRRIQLGISATSEDSENYPGCSSAQKKLLLIPSHLIKRVMEAIQGLKCGVCMWKKDHEHILNLDDEECVFYWRCDGTIDTLKTAQQLVLNSNIDIEKRFHLACMYCLTESIQTLRAEMVATGKMENRIIGDDDVVSFWIRWLGDGSRVPWEQLARECLETSNPAIRLNFLFNSLHPEARRLILRYIVTNDDLRFCLYGMTKEEEEMVLKDCPAKVLYSFMQCPMRTLFLETADKMWKYFDAVSYNSILNSLLSSEINREIFDFYDFFERFWNSSPNNLRESVKEFPCIREKIESCFNEMRRKRIADFESRNSKNKN